jgi:hypothetical protein
VIASTWRGSHTSRQKPSGRMRHPPKPGRSRRRTRPSHRGIRYGRLYMSTAAPTRFHSQAPRTALGSAALHQTVRGAGPALRTCGFSKGGLGPPGSEREPGGLPCHKTVARVPLSGLGAFLCLLRTAAGPGIAWRYLSVYNPESVNACSVHYYFPKTPNAASCAPPSPGTSNIVVARAACPDPSSPARVPCLLFLHVHRRVARATAVRQTHVLIWPAQSVMLPRRSDFISS